MDRGNRKCSEFAGQSGRIGPFYAGCLIDPTMKFTIASKIPAILTLRLDALVELNPALENITGRIGLSFFQYRARLDGAEFTVRRENNVSASLTACYLLV